MDDIINNIDKCIKKINNNYYLEIKDKLNNSGRYNLPYKHINYNNDTIFLLNLKNINYFFLDYNELINLYTLNKNFSLNEINYEKINNIIISVNKKKIIFMGFYKNIRNFFDTSLNNFFIDIKKLFYRDIKHYIFTECYEGFQINVYYHNNEWIISTKNKFNAEESKWRSHKNFKEIFIEILNKKFNDYNIFFNKLNKNYSYIFLVKSHHILKLFDVYEEDDNIYHLMTRDMYRKNFPKVNHDIGLNLPKSRIFNSFDELNDEIKYGTNMNSKKIQGYYCEELNLKIYYPEYLELKIILLNSSNIDYVMINLIFNCYYDINYIFDNFEKYINIYNEFKINYDKFLKYLHKIYTNKFVKKNDNIKIKNIYKSLIRYIHSVYLLKKKTDKNFKMDLQNLKKIFIDNNINNKIHIIDNLKIININCIHKAFKNYKLNL